MSARWLGLDVVAVLAFVAIGRDTHQRGNTLGGLVATATPFLIGVAAGWMVTRAWDNPAALRTGFGIAMTTVAVGMVLRRLVFDDGIAVTFVAVATAFLTLFIAGWRLLPIGYRRIAAKH